MMNSKWFSTLLMSLTLVSFAVSCTQKPKSETAGETEAAVDRINFQTGPNEFAFNNGAEPETLDPHKMSALNDHQLAVNMHETLIVRANGSDELKPGLAASWSLSADKKTYTFKIRENLKWSNGEDLTTAQIRQSFVRAIDPKVANPYFKWYLDAIVGARELYEGFDSENKEQLLKNYGVRVKDAQTLEIELVKPIVYFDELLTALSFAPIHPSMMDPDSKAWTTPEDYIVSGAYTLDSWDVNKKIILKKNPNYWDASSVSFETITAFPIVDQQISQNLYTTGKVDWSGENTIASALVPSLEDRPDFHIRPIFGTYMYVFNVKEKPLDDLNVRKALYLAVDRERITDQVLRGGQKPVMNYVPPGVEGYETLYEAPETFEARVEKAKSLLTEAGFPNGEGFPTITVLYNTSESHKKVAQAVQQMWKQNLGIDVKMENQEWKVFLKTQDAGNFQISRMGWIGDIPDPGVFMEIFTSENGNNKTNWASAEFDKIIKETAAMTDSEKRLGLLEKAEKILLDAAPIIPIYNYTFYSLMNPEVKGFKPNLSGVYYFKHWSKSAQDS